MPSDFAKSSSRVTNSNDDQFDNINVIAMSTPIYIPHISVVLTVSISPNKNACRSILILLNEITIIPTANAKCAKTPRSVSEDKALLCCSHKNKIPNNRQIKTTPKLIPIPSNIPKPAPSKEL